MFFSNLLRCTHVAVKTRFRLSRRNLDTLYRASTRQERGRQKMTTHSIRQATEFPALVTGAFFVRNAVVIATLLTLVVAAFVSN
jgi:hypothetical protein